MRAPGITLSLVSHGQSALCAPLLADLARLASPVIEKLIYIANIPETLPPLGGMPFPVEVVRNPRPLGFGANHNQAFARITSEFFAVLNPDLRLESDPFPALIARLADASVGLVTPLVLGPDGTPADFARRMVSPWEILRRRFGISEGRAELDRPDWLAGMFLVFRSATYAELGGFDTRYFLYCEDVDLCARIRLRGMRLVVARDVPVTHYAQRGSHRSLRLMLMHGTSLLRFWNSPVYRSYRRLLRQQPAGSGHG